MSQETPELSVVIPVHNELDNVRILVDRLTQVLQITTRLMRLSLSMNGSVDGTYEH